MRRSLPSFPLLLLLLPLSCGSEIILGDSESPLPLAGASGSSSGSSSTGGGGSGAGGSSVEPHPPGARLWSADHEVGDFSDWEQGGELRGGHYGWGDVNGYVESGVGRDGSNGVVASINTDARGETSGGVRMYRRIESSAAYYSAWFRLEDAHSVLDWWSILLFHARVDPLSLEDDVSLWDVRVVDDAQGQLSLQFFDHETMLGTAAPGEQGLVAPGTWFELRAQLDYRPPDATRLRIWRENSLLFDVKELRTAPHEHVFWCVGNGAGKLSPADSILYLDDAEIRAADAP